MKFIKYTFLGLLVATIVACGTTRIQDKSMTPKQGVAYIKGIPGWNPLYAAGIQIYRIDDNKVSRVNNTYELAPGNHKISVRCTIEQPEFVSKSYIFNIDMLVSHTYHPVLDTTQACALHFIDAASKKVFIGVPN